MVNSFSIYKEYYELITLLSEKEQGELLLAITKYMFEDIEPTLNSKQTKIFNNLKRPLDKSKEQSKRKRNKNQTETKKEPKENRSSNQTKTHQAVPVNVNVNVKDSYSYCEEQFGRTLSPVEYKLISKWHSWFDDEVINYAIDKTIKNGARALSYTEAIINSWHDKGFKTLHECELENKEDKPEWFDKKIEEEKATDEEMKKMEDLLNEYK